MTPEDLKYTAEHEWVRVGEGDVVRIGITDYAQGSLGDIVFVNLPEVGARVEAGQTMGEVESTKSVSDLYAPLTGTVVGRNDVLDGQPELINSDPYGEGWMVEISADAGGAGADALLDAVAYQELTEAG
ncbi:MAG: glycine cleavage system protein GcvH [Actinobacteria bacterium]|nr:glycine cleavage system protein GcvH [Actinomycetota bacterium]